MTVEAKTYKTAGAFRTALETRLQNRARGRICNVSAGKWPSTVFWRGCFSKGPNAPYPWARKGERREQVRAMPQSLNRCAACS
jgi:hypothetical protein